MRSLQRRCRWIAEEIRIRTVLFVLQGRKGTLKNQLTVPEENGTILTCYNRTQRRGVLHRNSVFRKLLVDAKQQKDPLELTSERLSEIPVRESKHRRYPTVTGEGYKIVSDPYLMSVQQSCEKEWYRVRTVVFRLLNTFR